MFLVSHTFGRRLKGELCSNVLQLLRDLGRHSFELFADVLLGGQRQQWKRLAKIAVDHVLGRVVVGSEREVISAAQQGVLVSQVHLEALKEVVIFLRTERHQNADRAGQRQVDQALGQTVDQRGLLDGGHRFAQMKLTNRFDFLRCAA